MVIFQADHFMFLSNLLLRGQDLLKIQKNSG